MDRPKIIVNVAATADGKVDTTALSGVVISSIANKARVDRLRAGVDAVLSGSNTLVSENPGLVVKSLALRMERKAMGLPENPVLVVIVNKIEPDNLPTVGSFTTLGNTRVLIFTTQFTSAEVITLLKDSQLEVVITDGERVDLRHVFESLYSKGIRSILVEGDSGTISDLFHLGWVDELMIYISPHILGGAFSPTMAEGDGFSGDSAPLLRLLSADKFDAEGGVLLHYEVAR